MLGMCDEYLEICLMETCDNESESIREQSGSFDPDTNVKQYGTCTPLVNNIFNKILIKEVIRIVDTTEVEK